MSQSSDVLSALDAATASLIGGGERRDGQAQMCAAVADAIDEERHLIVQAGTGTGKSLAYLVPLFLSGRKAVISTATKALQDQLAGKDLPHVKAALDSSVTFAVLKGRSNYICCQKLVEQEADDQLELDGVSEGMSAELEVLAEWAKETNTGDRAELKVEPSTKAWAAVSVGPRECPGATNCPQGASCFTELAKARAAAADIIVVNTHLYGAHLASENAVLPEHDLVVIDEAHQLEEVISNTAGLTLSPGRFSSLANNVQSIFDDPQLIADLHASADSLEVALEDHADKPVTPAASPVLANALMLGQERANQVITAARNIPKDAPEEARSRAQRATKAATSLVDDIQQAFDIPATHVAWVVGGRRPELRIAPIDVSNVLAETLWPEVTAILTSATLPTNIDKRLGMHRNDFIQLDLGSPFDYQNNAMLYCPSEMPNPKSPEYEDAKHAEIEKLIVAAGGRTLALFTSWRAMNAAADHLDGRLPWPVHTQSDMPKMALIDAFSEDPEASLFATMSFWQGVDVPGPSLSLVIIDRIPFPRPDDPLLQARRDQIGSGAFGQVDLPRAAMLLAQGAGRLIRRGDDKGVVAVLDSRLATSRSYRWELINALPPFKRTGKHEEAAAFLRELRDANE